LPADQNQTANLMAHAVLGAVVGHFNGNATVGAVSAFTAEAAAPAIINAMGWDKDHLTEQQKQTVSALGTLAAGLAGGLVGDSSNSAVAGAQAGKNAVENNALGNKKGCGLDPLACRDSLIEGGGIRGGGRLGSSISSSSKVVTVDKTKYPESAKHIEDAQKAGQPATLTIDRAGAAQRRKESLKDTPSVKGKDRDEYPPAMFNEGGAGSSIRPISPGDNRGAGACIGAQCRGLPDGTSVIIKTSKGN
ncbi:VENN motif pre-toxin domain-containing protein, partial [Yersinia intermedia]